MSRGLTYEQAAAILGCHFSNVAKLVRKGELTSTGKRGLADGSRRSQSSGRPAAPIADRLLADPDVGIRARTVKSLGSLGGEMQRSLQKVADEDDDPGVRELAERELSGD